MTFPTTVDTITDGSTVIVASHIKTLQNQLVGPYLYNVKGAPFNAVGDGITDDGAALALAAGALTSNSILWIPAGTFLTSLTLTITGLTNVWIDGPGTLKLKNTTNLPVVRFQNCIGGGVRNLTIDGNQGSNTSPGALGNQGVYIGNVASGSTQVNVIGARIQNCYNDGVYVLNSTRCRVEGNYITGCGTATNGGTPIHFLQGSNDGEIIGNICDSNAYGIYVEANATTSSQRCRIIGNVVSNCSGTNAALAQGAGIALAGAPYSIVQGNHCYGATTLRGIVLFPGGTTFPSDHSTIQGNTTSSNGHNGIDITGNFLRCIGNHSEVNGQAGIFLSGDLTPVDASWCVIANNVCRNNGTAGGAGGTLPQDGIIINTVTGANITDNVISGNVCTDNGTGNQKYGIREWQANASYLRNIYIGNVVRGNATAGILLLGTTNSVVNNPGYTPTTFDTAGTAFNFPTDLTITAGTHGISNSAGPLILGAANSGSGFLFNVAGQGNKMQIDLRGHLFALDVGAPSTTNKGANVTSVTFTGNDVRGSIAIVMAGALAANTRIATCTYSSTYGTAPGAVILVSETSGAGLVIVNFYSGAESATAFDLFCEQALATGTYTIKYIVIG